MRGMRGAAGHETVGALLGMDLRTAAVWADCVKGVSRQVPATAGAPSAWPTKWADETLQAGREVFRGVIFAAADVERHTWAVTLPPGYAAMREGVQHRQLVLERARLAAVVEKVFP